MRVTLDISDILCRYDVTGVPADRIHSVLAQDWTHLMRNKKILDSPNYLHEKGRPVVGLWGMCLHIQLSPSDDLHSLTQ